VGKCEALVPREVVSGRTVLDLGACIGAMCHWSLSAGAVRAVAVECQADFCVRSAELLRRAQGEDQWPAVPTAGWTRAPLPTSPELRVHADEERFGVVEAGMREFLAASGDRSFDVVIAAGVLQCFPDPVVVVNELLRVTGRALVLEVDNGKCLLVPS
jgi:SAM-dependent methyltransferase